MTDYIINPMWFYWLQVADGLRNLLLWLGVIIMVLVLTFGMCYIQDSYDEVKALKCVSATLLIPILMLVTSCLIPSKETLIEMEIARHATYSNLETIEETIKEATDYVIDKVRGDVDD